jgi:hypothetical protein
MTRFLMWAGTVTEHCVLAADRTTGGGLDHVEVSTKNLNVTRNGVNK